MKSERKIKEPTLEIIKDERADGNGLIDVAISGLEIKLNLESDAKELNQQIEQESQRIISDYLETEDKISYNVNLKNLKVFNFKDDFSVRALYHVNKNPEIKDYEVDGFGD